jgi:uncharacterized protein (TIGR02246 family)
MNLKVLRLFFAAALLLCAFAGREALAQEADEAAIRQAVQTMQDGWNQKKGAVFASSFAQEHDYVVVNGMFLPKMSREANAQAHQGLFDGVYKEVDLKLSVAKIRFLTPEIAVAHVQGFSYPRGKMEEKRQEVVITTVFQKGKEGWKIIAFQNTPVEQRTQHRPGAN